ncbi:hypothetical protein HN873_001810 [Arachis hypogaea]
MAGSSQEDKTKLEVSIQHECLPNIFPLELWSSIATMVASNSIEDLFNMQASCRLFASACNSDAVYRHTLVSVLPIACFLDYSGTPAMTFLHRCARARNPAAMLRVGLSHLFWCGHRRGGMRTLAEAAELGDLEACYIARCCFCRLVTKQMVRSAVDSNFFASFVTPAQSKGAGRSSRRCSPARGLINPRRTQKSPCHAVPVVAVPVGPLVMTAICPVWRVCNAWPNTRCGSSWGLIAFK